MTSTRGGLLGGVLALCALLIAFVGSAAAHVEYVRPDESQPVAVAQFLVEALTTPFILAVLLGGFAVIVAGLAVYLVARPFPADIAAFREIMDDYRDLLPWLFRLSMGMPMIGAGFGGYFFSPSVQLPYPTALRLFGISVGFLLLFGLATRVVAVATLLIYLAVLPFQPGLLLAFEYVPGLLAVALLGGGRPSADELIARMANDDRTVYSPTLATEPIRERLLFGGSSPAYHSSSAQHGTPANGSICERHPTATIQSRSTCAVATIVRQCPPTPSTPTIHRQCSSRQATSIRF